MIDSLYKLKLPLKVATLKEDVGLDGLYKYLRTYRLFSARFSFRTDKEDLSQRINWLLFTSGEVALYYDKVMEKVFALEIVSKKCDANGNPYLIDCKGCNNYKKSNLKLGEDVIILNHDNTSIPPFLYCWYINEEVIKKEDIINQQDNMLRKPILIKGQGKDFDNMRAKLENILSGVEFINVKDKGSNKTIMESLETEVLNLQVGNAYKGKELYESRDKKESLILDYLGYPSVNGDKKERLITSEVNRTSSVAQSFYKETIGCIKKGLEDFNKISPIKVEVTETIEWEQPEENKEDEDNVNNQDNLG